MYDYINTNKHEDSATLNNVMRDLSLKLIIKTVPRFLKLFNLLKYVTFP